MSQKAEMNKVLAVLAEAGADLVKHQDIVRQGTQLSLPERMDARDAIRILEDHVEQQENYIQSMRSFDYLTDDGIVATHRVLERTFGTTGKPVGQRTMFGSTPPVTKEIPISATETIQLPIQELSFPVLGDRASLYLYEPRRPTDCFKLGVHAPQGRAAEVEGLFRLIEHELQTNSIYRGKAITADGTFLDITSLDPETVVYSTETMAQLDSNVWSALRDTDLLRELGLSVKRACLLHGPYGSGKTLAGLLTAQHAVENGWTFITAKAGVADLNSVLETARLYAPAVVFFEDVDTLSNPHSAGPDAVSQLLDTFDGLQAKGKEILAVLTTNHPEKIHRGMVRPGRLDAVIPVGHLDRAGVQRLIEVSVPEGTLDPNVDFDLVYESLQDMEPAFIKEAIERTTRYHVAATGTVGQLTTTDFLLAADGLRPQLEMMQNAPEHSRVLPPLEDTFSSIICEQLHQEMPELFRGIEFADSCGDRVEIGDAAGLTY